MNGQSWILFWSSSTQLLAFVHVYIFTICCSGVLADRRLSWNEVKMILAEKSNRWQGLTAGEKAIVGLRGGVCGEFDRKWLVFLFLEWSQTPYIFPLLLHQLPSFHLMHINSTGLIYSPLSVCCSLTEDVPLAYRSWDISHNVHFTLLLFQRRSGAQLFDSALLEPLPLHANELFLLTNESGARYLSGHLTEDD